MRISPKSAPMLAGVGFRSRELSGLLSLQGAKSKRQPWRMEDKIALPSTMGMGRAW
jgi:hypothetical protein